MPKNTSDPTPKDLEPTQKGSKGIESTPSGSPTDSDRKLLLGHSPKEVVLAQCDPLLAEDELLAICVHETPPDHCQAEESPEDMTSFG